MGKFTNAQRLQIIAWAEKYGNVSAAVHFNCSDTTVGRTRKIKKELEKSLREAEEKDKKRNFKRRYPVKQADGTVRKEWKVLQGNKMKYMLSKYRNAVKLGRTTDARYLIFDQYTESFGELKCLFEIF